jgi:hypothetical protein
MLGVRSELIILTLVVAVSSFLFADDSKPEDLIARHLQSIGTPEARQGSKSRVMEGTANYRVLVGGAGQLSGKAALVSESHKINLLLKVMTTEYHGEQIVFDGDRVKVVGTYADKRRSEFGDFILANDAPIREGLLGGVLSTAWALEDVDSRKPKLQLEGIKQIDGRSVEVLRYQPKKGTALQITLYFDPATGRHVKTLYTASQQPVAAQTVAISDPRIAQMDSADARSARSQQTRYRMEEDFADFQTVDGLTLPTSYQLRFTEEMENGFTKSVWWNVSTNRILNNVSLDSRNFEAR